MYKHHHSIYGVLAWLIYSTPPSVRSRRERGGFASTRFLLRISPTNPYEFFSQFYCFPNTIHIPATYSHIIRPHPLLMYNPRCRSLRIYRPRTKHTRSLTRPYSLVAAAASSSNITTYTIHQSFATLSLLLSAPVNNDIFAKTHQRGS